MTGLEEQNPCSSQQTENQKEEGQPKPSKRGIIYLSSIPPYMNVTKLRELFSQYGKVGRVYLQLHDKGIKAGDKDKKKRKKVAKKFTEGWIEFEKKCVAKKVATLLNNKQVSSRKKSKHYDCIWNIKYLSNFKWTHLHERLAYEKAARNKKLTAEIQLAKKKSNFFTANLDKKKKNEEVVNREYENMDKIATTSAIDVEDPREDHKRESRNEFLQSLFS